MGKLRYYFLVAVVIIIIIFFCAIYIMLKVFCYFGFFLAHCGAAFFFFRGLFLIAFLFLHRRATDLEPLQPLIKKFIGFLEAEVLPSATKTSRPRAELDRVSIWLGIKSL